MGFPCGSTGKESACNAGDLGSIPGLGRSPEEGKGYPLRYSGLENSCIVHGVAKSRTPLSDFHFHFTFRSSGVGWDRVGGAELSQGLGSRGVAIQLQSPQPFGLPQAPRLGVVKRKADPKVILAHRCLLPVHPGLGPGQRRSREALQDPEAGHRGLLHHHKGPV